MPSPLRPALVLSVPLFLPFLLSFEICCPATWEKTEAETSVRSDEQTSEFMPITAMAPQRPPRLPKKSVCYRGAGGRTWKGSDPSWSHWSRHDGLSSSGHRKPAAVLPRHPAWRCVPVDGGPQHLPAHSRGGACDMPPRRTQRWDSGRGLGRGRPKNTRGPGGGADPLAGMSGLEEALGASRGLPLGRPGKLRPREGNRLLKVAQQGSQRWQAESDQSPR